MSTSAGSPTLLLVPTELELQRLADHGVAPLGFALRALCGFGPVAAAARTAHLLATLRPRRVLLVGIAGGYDVQATPIGTALEFGAVALHGVGAGEGASFLGPPALGFPQWPGSDPETPHVDDCVPLSGPRDAPLLLTTCAASDGSAQATERRERFPAAVAEDMEGFGVALACALARTPLRVVRGISNRVGDRDAENWRIPAALAAAGRLARELLAQSAWSAEVRP